MWVIFQLHISNSYVYTWYIFIAFLECLMLYSPVKPLKVPCVSLLWVPGMEIWCYSNIACVLTKNQFHLCSLFKIREMHSGLNLCLLKTYLEDASCKRTHFLWSALGITPIKQLILFIYKKRLSKIKFISNTNCQIYHNPHHGYSYLRKRCLLHHQARPG